MNCPSLTESILKSASVKSAEQSQKVVMYSFLMLALVSVQPPVSLVTVKALCPDLCGSNSL